MPPPATPSPANNAQSDDNHDVVGWDNASDSIGQPWHEPPPVPAKRASLAGVLLRFGLVLALVLIVLAVAIPNMMASKITNCGGPGGVAGNSLKAIATAQAQYYKRFNCYADSAWRLNQAGTLISADLKFAFEDYQSDGDSTTPVPKAGYIFRMLHGDVDSGAYGFYNNPNDRNAGMTTWGATCRAADPGTSGENQYYISEAGTVYKFAEPLPGTPRYKQFLLDRLPQQSQVTWSTAK
ncbi:MAG TPA: hypothetical protein VL860_06790 [Planctomycetota bacterium]|nr:hypothetical protein [Planctomycetota bacterium]